MHIHLDDKRLAKQLVTGSEEAFRRFFDENFPRLYRFALPRLDGNVDIATEMAQQTLSKALRGLHGYRGEAALFTWLCTICRNEIADWMKAQGRLRQHIVLTEDFAEIKAAVESMHGHDSDDPEANYRRLETVRLIEVALDQLPPKYGDALEWKYIQGETVQEIALRFDIGHEAAASLLARAKRAFSDVYGALISTERDLATRSTSS